ncbi:DUF4382 domain-containing protein [Vibrio aestuarianus]|uniref:hypothetical protein n=1 Tax=Vibrio aestuarianus TaxID=28171 RepID=UPI00237D1A87|nr:hypothetical protein [Vibrio aestuarianus]MDE1221665.1 DUF4382 domain-containing protein [Vibrio aestuarianus]MDE1249597.1 DUF4382 domain-containing protein [Vibrio aestuarianus]
MTTNMKFFLLSAISVAVLSGCGSDSAPQQKTAKVSFSITDAPVDTAVEVNVTYKSLIVLLMAMSFTCTKAIIPMSLVKFSKDLF